MRVIVFCYAFPHQRTCDGLTRLLSLGLRPELVWAADSVKLDLPTPVVRTSTRGLIYPTASEICRKSGVDYVNASHDDLSVLQDRGTFDLGVILGARVLKRPLLEALHCPTLNLHPGVLPDNRGLDSRKWAAVHHLPQAVTAHFIDEKIDRGAFVAGRIVPVMEDDTIVDLAARMASHELDLLTTLLCEFQESPGTMQDMPSRSPIPPGSYTKAMTLNEEFAFAREWPDYVLAYREVVQNYLDRSVFHYSAPPTLYQPGPPARKDPS